MDDQNTNQNPDQNAEKLREISEIYNNLNPQQGATTTGLEIQKSPIDYYILAFQKYAQFSGRSTRNEYWWFYILTFAISILLSILDELLGLRRQFELIFGIYLLISFLPSVAVLVRRLHDVGRSGWLIFLPLVFSLISFLIIPIIFVLISSIWLFILITRDSMPGDNKYGPNPKGVST